LSDSTELDVLHQVAQLLGAGEARAESLEPVLELLGKALGLTPAYITLLDAAGAETVVDAAPGLSSEQRRAGRYRPGEGVTGRVLASGTPMVVPSIQREASMLNRTGALVDGNDQAFICVPIFFDDEVVGTLGAATPSVDASTLAALEVLLTSIAAMLAPTAVLRRNMRNDRRHEKQLQRLHGAEGEETFRAPEMVGRSRVMQPVMELVARVAHSDATVLILGESGVGKELIAQAIHDNSSRTKGPFVRVNCAALPHSLLESELFGHEEGAFTGAVHARKGRFELAHKGSIFLDEIGDIPPATQVFLLRVLQERQFERVGGTETLSVDVRVIVATNRDLQALVTRGDFREDLYYRLNVFPIHVPPLRKRLPDIPRLTDRFAHRFGEANGKPIRRIATSAIDLLTAYHWPGNVRELENCIERAVLMSDGGVIHGHDLPPTLQTAEASGTRPGVGLQATLDRVERDIVTDALKDCAGNMAEAARMLEISARKMGLRVRKYHIDAKRFRPGS